ncbi:M1 family metallopeptidase [Streptomyces sp. NPDC051776]|uniref:M1 family metallopeptidase n=1 Tax=Streptomyces sp. NPDC051776 TaxID=3155414 RepID=UPI00343EB864
MRPTVRSSRPAAALVALLAVLGAGAAGQPDRPEHVAAATTARTHAGPTRVAYDVSLSGDKGGARWTGRESVTFTNTTGGPLREVYLRLWGNAWDGCERPTPVRVTRVEGGTSRGLSAGCTALRIDLPGPLAHGARTTVAFDVELTAPRRTERFGRDGPYTYLGNALPVLGVHDAQGWHLDRDVGFGESYYTLAAGFRVRLYHPSDLKVPTTGTAVTVQGDGRNGTGEGGNGTGAGRSGTGEGGNDGDGSARSVTTATAHRVRDFAWAAGPFATATTESQGGVRVTTFRPAATPAPVASSTRRLAAEALDDFGARFGRYPYSEADLVLHQGFGTTPGDMEYPGLVLLNSRAAGGATVHEMAHQWWYGIVGNDQFDAPWLDEGFAVYAEDLFRGDRRPDCRPATGMSRSMGHWAGHEGAWKSAVYKGGSCALHALEREIGGSAMARLMKDYARDHWHGVSTSASFRRAAQAVTARELGPFWREHGIR